MALLHSIYPIEQVSIGAYSGGGAMLVRQYGELSGAERALFFIGQIHHGDESGAGDAIRLMETSIQGLELPKNTLVYLLNPAGGRFINGIDLNHDFLDQRLSETRARRYRSVLIVSAHQYNDRNRGTLGRGFVFPLYEFTGAGRQKIAGKAGDAIISMNTRLDYTTEAMLKDEMYPGELMYFVSRWECMSP
jgi:hypothetical protein